MRSTMARLLFCAPWSRDAGHADADEVHGIFQAGRGRRRSRHEPWLCAGETDQPILQPSNAHLPAGGSGTERVETA